MCPRNPINFFCGHNQTLFIELSEDGHRPATTPCGACRTSIVGKLFQCSVCSLSLHPLCKSRPNSISSFLHHHPLTLVTTAAAAAAAPPSRRCDVCFEPIRGVYYTCLNRHCDFDVHPQCSQISPRVRHVLDPCHALEFQQRPAYATRCNVCGGECGGWAYRCGTCHVDVHYWCLWKPAATSTRQLRHNYDQSFYFGQSNYSGYGAGNNSTVPYWWPGNFTGHHNVPTGGPGSGSGSGSGLGIGPGVGMMNITGSLAVNLLSNLTSNLIQNGFLF